MSPIAVMRTSRIVLGWAVFVATVPLGMMQLFRFAARLPVRMGSRQYAKARLAQLECEHAVWVAKLEDKDRQMARERASVATAASSLSKSMSSPTQQPRPLSLSPQQNRRKRSFAVAGPAAEDHANPFYGGQEMSRYDILGKLRLLEYEIARLRKELYVSPWKRNAAFFGLLAISLSIYGRLLVLLAKSLIFGHPVPSASTSSPHVPPPSSPSSSAFSWMEYNTVSSSEATTMASNFAATAVPLGPSSHFPTMPWAMWLLADTPSATRFLWDAAVDIFWIFMVMALALYGLYHHPYYRKLRPRQGRTTPLAMIANVPIVLTLATASWSLMVDCLGILQSPSVWAVRGTGARTTEPMTTTTTTTTTTTAATTGFLPLRAEDPTRQLLWDTDMFDLVLGDKRQVLESLVRTAMFVMLSMLGAQWIVHRLIGLQNRR
ncbi:hypothetical protein BGZ73_001115 [Actinomortierella ambigua]|nr:hypothetical protein BGZ73_001115 [Actinomortierella ambigua]